MKIYFSFEPRRWQRNTWPLNDSVKAVKIDGADATVANINNGNYKISRLFNIAVKEGLSPWFALRCSLPLLAGV